MTPLVDRRVVSLMGSAPRRFDAATTVWLFDGPAQVRDGPHAGAVVGTVDGEQRALYAYPEITGYFLQWLAWRAARYGAETALVQRAVAAQAWLRRWLGGVPPPTRIHLHESVDDWRNSASFCFDIAMVLRGLGSAASQRLLEVDPAVVEELAQQLEQLIANDGIFVACKVHTLDAAPLPDRWSTRRGGFLAKAAAGVVTAARALPAIPPHVVQAAADTFAASLRWHAVAPHNDVHALLYTFEGILGLPQHPRFHAVLPSIAVRFDDLLAQVGPRGQIAETIAPALPVPGPYRVDVIAQMLRVGQLLGLHRPQCPPDRVALARLRQVLLRQVAPSGAVPFALAQQTPQWNVWAAMFADQALTFASRRDARGTSSHADPLIV